MNDPSTHEAAAGMQHALAELGADVDVHRFTSGAVALAVSRGRVLVSVQGTAVGEWGWTVNPHPDEGMTGHDHVSDDPQAVLASITAALEDGSG